ncbi:PI-actitoxin-Avd5a-like [Palaemon carinicauda]|uniref:PI-actitoxin-Avd5a-like n=1 Tax=Palaemon carinicauda TaxID=392227 RepID=UPI0035B5DFDC
MGFSTLSFIVFVLLLVESKGRPQNASTTVCSEVCPFNYEPVCGNNGKTYANSCLFEAAACRDPLIKIAHQGPCAGDSQSLPEFLG